MQEYDWRAKQRYNLMNYFPSRTNDWPMGKIFRGFVFKKPAKINSNDPHVQFVRRMTKYAMMLGIRPLMVTSLGDVPTKRLEEFKKLYKPEEIILRQNVPENIAPQAREWLAGYYAHCSALDSCIENLQKTIRECGIEKNTIFVFTSDHGDMLGSQGHTKKQQPWDESIRVPFLIKYPELPKWNPRETDAFIDAHDIMPTLLGLCGIDIPGSVEGVDFSKHICGEDNPVDDAALILCPHPFGQWLRPNGGREYRGLRTKRYTYCRDLNSLWLLYDNEKDPYQLNNLVSSSGHNEILKSLDELLSKKLEGTNDKFLPGMEYIKKWGYEVDEDGTVPYTP